MRNLGSDGDHCVCSRDLIGKGGYDSGSTQVIEEMMVVTMTMALIIVVEEVMVVDQDITFKLMGVLVEENVMFAI